VALLLLLDELSQQSLQEDEPALEYFPVEQSAHSD